MERAIRELFDLPAWRGLLGRGQDDGEPTAEDRERFTLALRDLLEVVLEQKPEPGALQLSKRPGAPNAAGYAALRKLLTKA